MFGLLSCQIRSFSAVMKNSKTIIVKSVKYNILEELFVSMGASCSVISSKYVKYDIPKYQMYLKISDIEYNGCTISCSSSKFTHKVSDIINLLPEESVILGKDCSEHLM